MGIENEKGHNCHDKSSSPYFYIRSIVKFSGFPINFRSSRFFKRHTFNGRYKNLLPFDDQKLVYYKKNLIQSSMTKRTSLFKQKISNSSPNLFDSFSLSSFLNRIDHDKSSILSRITRSMIPLQANEP